MSISMKDFRANKGFRGYREVPVLPAGYFGYRPHAVLGLEDLDWENAHELAAMNELLLGSVAPIIDTSFLKGVSASERAEQYAQMAADAPAEATLVQGADTRAAESAPVAATWVPATGEKLAGAVVDPYGVKTAIGTDNTQIESVTQARNFDQGSAAEKEAQNRAWAIQKQEAQESDEQFARTGTRLETSEQTRARLGVKAGDTVFGGGAAKAANTVSSIAGGVQQATGGGAAADTVSSLLGLGLGGPALGSGPLPGALGRIATMMTGQNSLPAGFERDPSTGAMVPTSWSMDRDWQRLAGAADYAGSTVTRAVMGLLQPELQGIRTGLESWVAQRRMRDEVERAVAEREFRRSVVRRLAALAFQLEQIAGGNGAQARRY